MLDRPVFFFDLASPYAYLASTRVEAVLGDVTWQPVLVGALHKHYRRVSWGSTAELRAAGVAEIEQRARAYGLPRFVWPAPYPANTLTAMRAAVFAQQHGRAREFARAALDMAFVEGRDLTSPEAVLLAAQRAGLVGSDLRSAIDTPALKQALRTVNDEAIARGVYGVPTVETAGRLWWGDDQLDAAAAAAAIGGARGAATPQAAAGAARGDLVTDRALPPEVVALVEFVRQLPYGRPSERSVTKMVSERRGTCSLKHLFLHAAVSRSFPDLQPRLVHRVHRVDRGTARRLFGPGPAEVVPEDGIVDVHRYLVLTTADGDIVIDATFPGRPWDGRQTLPLACGEGTDYPVLDDPDLEKRALERRFCDPAQREPFIAALSASSR